MGPITLAHLSLSPTTEDTGLRIGVMLQRETVVASEEKRPNKER